MNEIAQRIAWNAMWTVAAISDLSQAARSQVKAMIEHNLRVIAELRVAGDHNPITGM